MNNKKILYRSGIFVFLFAILFLVLGIKNTQPPKERSFTYLSAPKFNKDNTIAFIKGNNLFTTDYIHKTLRKVTSFLDEGATTYKTKIDDFFWSPDGSRISYVAPPKEMPQKQSGQPVIIILDNVTNKVLSVLPTKRASLQWVDSTRILFKDTPSGQRDGLYLINLDSNERKLIKNDGEAGIEIIGKNFALSPDGKHLAYVASANDDFLNIVDLVSNKNQLTDLSAGGIYNLQWSPSGQYLAYEVGSEAPSITASVYNINDKVDLSFDENGSLVGKSKSFYIRDIADFQNEGYTNLDIYEGRWIDVDSFSFITYKHTGIQELGFWSINMKTKKVKRLGGFKLTDQRFIQDRSGIIEHPSFSADHKNVIFKRSYGPDYKKQAIFSANIDGSDLKEIANNLSDN